MYYNKKRDKKGNRYKNGKNTEKYCFKGLFLP